MVIRAPQVVLPEGLVADAALAMAGGRFVVADGPPDVVLPAVRIEVEPAAASEAASRVPPDLLARAGLGRTAPGAPADLVWLDDELRARATWVGGELLDGVVP